MQKISIVLITYKSEKIIFEFIKKIPKEIKTIIIENSNNKKMKEEIENKYEHISVYIEENNGVSSSLNFAATKISTEYFLQISPDIDFNFNDLKIFLDLAEKLNNKFAAIGPRFTEVNKKGHKQIDENIEYNSIESIHGSCMFINKKNYNYIGGFDNNFFLFFEETEYCYRGKKKGYLSYQTNKSLVRSLGRSVDIKDKEIEKKIKDLLIWHFVWSKYYFTKVKYGNFLSLIIFMPLIIRINFKIIINWTTNNQENLKKYRKRLNGLLTSIRGEKSYLRL
jgi:N-acetylglucosaminyl-diphospho-decaprenol L-rhamnosyltransferase